MKATSQYGRDPAGVADRLRQKASESGTRTIHRRFQSLAGSGENSLVAWGKGRFADQQHLPHSLAGRRFYGPTERGYEAEVARR